MNPHISGLFRYLGLFCAISTGLLLPGCSDLPSGANRTYSTKVSADDGDKSNGGPNSDSASHGSSVTDGATFAVSHPSDFRQFFVIANARVGPKAQRLATANPSGETISYFEVNGRFSQTIQFSVHTILEPNITTGSSTVYFSLALAKMPGGTLVTPLRRYSYSLGPSSATPNQIDIKLDGNPLASMPNGGRYEDLQTFSAKFGSGTYKFDLTWDVISSADGKADLTAHTYIVAK